MVVIKQVLRESMPPLKLVGKRYSDADRDASGGYGSKWGEWFQNGVFGKLKACEGVRGFSDDFLGAMRQTAEGFEYWIGMFVSPADSAPEGFEEAEIPAGSLGVCYVYGKDGTGEIFGMEVHEACMKAWQDAGYEVADGGWFFERYNCPRYTTPDEKGNVILDYCAVLAR